MKNIILSILCFFALTNASFGQEDIILTMTTMTVEEDQTISVDITVQNWVDVASAQWSMHWDETVLDFVSISNFNLPGSAEGSFGTPPTTDDNTVTFSWFDEQVQGVNLQDDGVLFTLNFNVIGAMGATSSIMIDGVPTAIEVTKPSMQEIGVQIVEGSVTIDDTNALEVIHTKDFSLFANSPNPFKTTTNILFDLNEKSSTELSIYTLTGKLLFIQKYELPRGSHSLPIASDVFPASGTYIYRVATDSAVASRKLTLIN